MDVGREVNRGAHPGFQSRDKFSFLCTRRPPRAKQYSPVDLHQRVGISRPESREAPTLSMISCSALAATGAGRFYRDQRCYSDLFLIRTQSATFYMYVCRCTQYEVATYSNPNVIIQYSVGIMGIATKISMLKRILVDGEDAVALDSLLICSVLPKVPVPRHDV